MAHIDLPPTEALRAVLVAAQAGSFSAAAVALNLTHGAVSRRIAAVEHWAGLTLFARHGRGVRLTLEGQRLVARLESALALIEDGRASGGTEPELPVIRVGAVASFARLWLIPNLARLEAERPGAAADLRIEPEVDDRHMTLSDARIAIRLGRGGWPGVVAEPLWVECFQPVAARHVAEKLGPAPDAQQLLEFPLLHDGARDRWQVWLGTQGLAVERRPQDRLLPGHDLVLLAARAGLGIALARLPYSAAWPMWGELVPVHPLRVRSLESFHIVTRAGARHLAVERLAKRLSALGAEKRGIISNS